MVTSVLLDSCIFFECVEDPRNQTIINHAIHRGFKIVTPITVIGEVIDQMRTKPDRTEYILSFINLYEEWDVSSLYPDPVVAELCYHLANLNVDPRLEKTDRVHLGYAIAYGCDYFITSDTNLRKHRIPSKLESEGFYKPETLTLDEFKDIL